MCWCAAEREDGGRGRLRDRQAEADYQYCINRTSKCHTHTYQLHFALGPWKVAHTLCKLLTIRSEKNNSLHAVCNLPLKSRGEKQTVISYPDYANIQLLVPELSQSWMPHSGRPCEVRDTFKLQTKATMKEIDVRSLSLHASSNAPHACNLKSL